MNEIEYHARQHLRAPRSYIVQGIEVNNFMISTLGMKSSVRTEVQFLTLASFRLRLS